MPTLSYTFIKMLKLEPVPQKMLSAQGITAQPLSQPYLQMKEAGEEEEKIEKE